MLQTVTYTPQETAQLLKIRTNTVYELIKRGEIVAKKFGRVYRIPAKSLSFIFTGLDDDLYMAEQIDKKSLPKIRQTLQQVRKSS